MAAKVQLSYARVSTRARAETGSTMPVTDAPLKSDTLTSSASNQQFLSTPDDTIQFGRIAVSGGAVYVSIGLAPSDTPNATQAPRLLLPDGAIHWFSPAAAGIEVAVVDA